MLNLNKAKTCTLHRGIDFSLAMFMPTALVVQVKHSIGDCESPDDDF